MPGYSVERFVDLSQSEKSELICSICQDILRCPVVTHCCLQSFCDDCINDWLKTNSTCPYDQKSLSTDQLSRAPRVVMNLLGKLRIRCDFSDNGCNEVLALENLSNHSQQCQYNYENKECEKCFCKNTKANHDCVQYLLAKNIKITVEANQLKVSYEELIAINTNISIELNHLKKRFEDMVTKVGNTDSSYSTDSGVNNLQQMNDLTTHKSHSNSSASFSKTSHETKSEEELYSPDIYRVKLIDSNASIRCGLRSDNDYYYTLIVTSSSISLARDGKMLYVWPLRQIRRNGCTENSFTLEAGRRSISGDGLFSFVTKHGNDIFRTIATQVNRVDASRHSKGG